MKAKISYLNLTSSFKQIILFFINFNFLNFYKFFVKLKTNLFKILNSFHRYYLFIFMDVFYFTNVDEVNYYFLIKFYI